ncbi:MAG: hypothetical protein ACYC01_04615 [Lutibacter sp.]
MIGIFQIIILLNIVAVFIIAYYLGKKNQLGFLWSLFFGIFFTSVGGLIITLLSKKASDSKPKHSVVKIIIGYALILFYFYILFTNDLYPFYYSCFALLGFFGLGVYMIGIGNGKIYNQKIIDSGNRDEYFDIIELLRSNGYIVDYKNDWEIYGLILRFENEDFKIDLIDNKTIEIIIISPIKIKMIYSTLLIILSIIFSIIFSSFLFLIGSVVVLFISLYLYDRLYKMGRRSLANKLHTRIVPLILNHNRLSNNSNINSFE